jgi:hypothetical protein
MTLVLLLLVALGLAFVMSLIGGRFEIRRPATWLVVLGVAGAVFLVAGISLSESGPFAILALLGSLASLLALVGLLSLAILWAYRRWSGFYGER